MKLNFVNGWCGTDVVINGERKHTYGHTFKRITDNKGRMCLWVVLLIYLLQHENGDTRENISWFLNRMDGRNGNKNLSNHDLFFALKNCGIIYHLRNSKDKKTYWFANKEKAVELINDAIHAS